MKTNCSLLVLLCREDGERHRSQWAGEDMSAVQCNFIFYEIVRTTNFNFLWHIMLYPLFYIYIKRTSTLLHFHLLLFLSLPNYKLSTFVHFLLVVVAAAAHVLGWCMNCVYNVEHGECENKVTYCWSEGSRSTLLTCGAGKKWRYFCALSRRK
jgi:hypothetical protein